VNIYESYTVVVTDGRTAEGVIQRADSRWLVLRNSQREDTTIAREDIEELQRSHLSIMPKGLHANLNMDELSDLLAYLESLGKK
jgi:putative heme-binding domain-containing protein